MKYLLEVFRSIVFFGGGSAILFGLISFSYNDLLLDFKGIETEVKVEKVEMNVRCGGRKSHRLCNRFTLDIDGKSVVHSSDDSKIFDAKLTYLEGRQHIYKIGEKNKVPFIALMKKSLNVFPIFMLCMGLFAISEGFLGIKSNFENSAVKYSIVGVTLVISSYLGLNILEFFA